MIDSIYRQYRSPMIRGLLHERAPKGFAKVRDGVVDVFAKPLQNYETALAAAKNRNRSTQITKNDPSVELLSEVYDGWVLVRLVDKTVGWVPMEQLERVDLPTRPHEPLMTSREFVERYLGASYVRGGTTEKGIDCSGLAQRYYSQVRGCVIPRHSTDQWSAGSKIEEANRERGDLLNLRHKEGATDHIAVYLGNNEATHACLDRKGVVVEKIEDIEKRYAILGTTRPGPNF